MIIMSKLLSKLVPNANLGCWGPMLIFCRKRRLPSQAAPCSASSMWLRRQDLEESGILPALLAGDYGDCAPGKLPAEEVAEECAPCHLSVLRVSLGSCVLGSLCVPANFPIQNAVIKALHARK